MDDNYAPDSGSTVTSAGDATTAATRSRAWLQTSSAPVWNTGLTARKTANNGGVQPRADVRRARVPTTATRSTTASCEASGSAAAASSTACRNNGTARCQRGHAGGWPWIAQHTRKLTLPSNPNTVASNGYTQPGELAALDGCRAARHDLGFESGQRLPACQCNDGNVGSRHHAV